MTTETTAGERTEKAFYAISLEANDHADWQDIDETSSQLIVHWEEINTTSAQSLNDITIAVSQYYSYDDKFKITRIANDIQKIGEVQPADVVFGVVGDVLKRIGTITAKEVRSGRLVVVLISWITDVENGGLNEPLILELRQITRIKGRRLRRLREQFPTEVVKVYSFKSYPQLNPPFLIHTGDVLNAKFVTVDNTLITSPQVLKEDLGGAISIFYGTNRNALKAEGDIQHYGNDAGQLRLGQCVVHIPKGHVQGELERPGIRWFIRQKENEAEHVVIKSAIENSTEEFVANLQKRIADNSQKDALVFIHGYNTTFEEAARRTAQIAWDIPFNGTAGFFSWPSAGTYQHYLADEAKARTSVPEFKEFINLLLVNEELEQLHIIAHSMGSLVLSITLKELYTDPSMKNKLNKIFQVILGAPDIDQNEFRNTLLPAFTKVGRRRTIYTSDHDVALNASSVGRVFLKRLGQGGASIFLAKDLDSVEASNLPSESSHSYLFQNPMLLSDLYYLITKGLTPQERRLRQIGQATSPYWLFPKY
jgi:esterase/lipase superfamily enzyme